MAKLLVTPSLRIHFENTITNEKCNGKKSRDTFCHNHVPDSDICVTIIDSLFYWCVVELQDNLMFVNPFSCSRHEFTVVLICASVAFNVFILLPKIFFDIIFVFLFEKRVCRWESLMLHQQ